jgi:hypothetical protein
MKKQSKSFITVKNKHLKDFVAFPFFCIFFLGCGIAMIGWVFVEMITGESFKEIRIVKNEASTTENIS